MDLLAWRHNEAKMQWELTRDDGMHEPVAIAFITDEFLADVDMSRKALDEFVVGKYRVRLPPEAFAR